MGQEIDRRRPERREDPESFGNRVVLRSRSGLRMELKKAFTIFTTVTTVTDLYHFVILYPFGGANSESCSASSL